jgi:WD repeat-containing protein 19
MKELFVRGPGEFHSKGSVVARWDPHGQYLATCGKKKQVNIWKRSGESFKQFSVSGPVKDMQWDYEGAILAVLCEGGSNVVHLFSVNLGKELPHLETNLPSLTCMAWNRSGPQLAIGADKGKFMVYNNATKKKVAIGGTHSKKILCAAWNNDNTLAMAGKDNTMSISDKEGKLVDSVNVKSEPAMVRFSGQKVDDSRSNIENTVSIVMGSETILMYNLADTENPVELAFQSKYGEIVTYHWFGDGYMMVGFSKGFVVAISTHMREIGEELQSLQVHSEVLYDMIFSPTLNKLASCGNDGVRVVSLADWKECKDDYTNYNGTEGSPEKLHWTTDGQILTVTTSQGFVFNYLTSIPLLAEAHGTNVCYLSSLRHVSIVGVGMEELAQFEIQVEPSFLAMGPHHVAVGMNNYCWFHNIEDDTVLEKEYHGVVTKMCLNDTYSAALCDQKCHLHAIAADGDEEERKEEIFPPQEDGKVVSIGMTNDFLIYGTARGTLHHFYLKDWAAVNEYRHNTKIISIFPNPQGTRVFFIDDANKGFVYSPVDDHKVEVYGFPTDVKIVLWDPVDTACFVAVDDSSRQMLTYTYAPQTTKGASVQEIGQTKMPFGFSLISVCDGEAMGQGSSGGLTVVSLISHDAINFKGQKNAAKETQGFQQLLKLGRLKHAWDMSLTMQENKEENLRDLAIKCMDHLDIEQSIRVYRELKDTAMVLALQDILHVEDKHLLAGHCCMLLGDYDKAQKLFLSSSDAIAALHMRRDLLHWDQALKLARNLAPEQIPIICREYAQQLEVKGEYQVSLENYERALSAKVEDHLRAQHERQARAGIARMKLRLGDLVTGKQLAMESNDKILMKECAAILESMKQYPDAAEMFVKAECYEKAAAIFILTKNFRKAAPLMDKITTPKLHAQYGKAKEASKQYLEAADAYEKAKDIDSVIRLNLKYLDNPGKAFDLVRKTRSSEGAAMVAAYCTDQKQIKLGIEFLLMAKRPEEAFQLAQGHNEMEVYASVLGDDGTPEDYMNIAAYYEGSQQWGKAGKYHALVGDFLKAIKLFLQSGEEFIDSAIEVVKKANDENKAGADQLFSILHDYLVGKDDDTVKDPKYIFKLYMAIGEYDQAAKTAVLISNSEWKIGNYMVARGFLFTTHQDLVSHNMTVPADLTKSLLMLHSYTLVKKLVKAGDHKAAARMLIRVAKSISKFPAHVVPILTSTVIECQRAKLLRSSFEYASMLMRPEYRKSVDSRYKRKIETIVRRPAAKEENEKQTPCPICSEDLPQTQLNCPGCNSSLPFCATTGAHMTLSDWTFCPHCKFTHLYTPFVEWIKQYDKCSMCDEVVKLSSIQKVDDPKAFLKEQLEQAERDKKEAEERKKAGDAPIVKPKQANW